MTPLNREPKPIPAMRAKPRRHMEMAVLLLKPKPNSETPLSLPVSMAKQMALASMLQRPGGRRGEAPN